MAGIMWSDDAAGGALRSWLVSVVDDPAIVKRTPDAADRHLLANLWGDFTARHFIPYGPCVEAAIRGMLTRPPEQSDLTTLRDAVENDDAIRSLPPLHTLPANLHF